MKLSWHMPTIYADSPLFNVMMFSLFWALQIFVAKLGFIFGALILPFQLIMLIVATITVAVLLLPDTGTELRLFFKQQPALFWELFVANGIQAGLGTALSIIGISMTDAINAGFLVKLATVSTLIFARLILKESLSGLKLTILFVMLSGAYLLTTKGQNLFPRVGDLFIVGACICWSLGNVLVRRALKTRSVSADMITMQKPLAGLPVFLMLAGLSIIFPEQSTSLSDVLMCCTLNASHVLYAVGSGMCLAMAWIFLYRTMRVATASYMTLMSMITPIIVSVLALTMLNEQLVWIQIVGAGIIILSSVATYFSDIAYS